MTKNANFIFKIHPLIRKTIRWKIQAINKQGTTVHFVGHFQLPGRAEESCLSYSKISVLSAVENANLWQSMSLSFATQALFQLAGSMHLLIQ